MKDAAASGSERSERRTAKHADRRRTPRGGRRASDSLASAFRFPPRSAPLVLVVDDYADGREMTADYLRSVGFRVVEAATGFEAIKATTLLRPHLILLDLVLPDMDGWQVLLRLREANLIDGVKVAVHTANVTASARQQAQEWGVDLFFPRPCDLDLLGRQLASAIGIPPTER